MKFWLSLIKATWGSIVPAQSQNPPGPGTKPLQKRILKVDGVSAPGKGGSSSKKDRIEEMASAHLMQIKKLKSEYQKLVAAVQKELEKIKIEKVKKSL